VNDSFANDPAKASLHDKKWSIVWASRVCEADGTDLLQLDFEFWL